MTTCVDVCGTGGWTGPLPGDPDNNVILTATPAFGGIDVTWTYPAINPFAVAHTLLYRGNTPNFVGAIQRQVVAGNFFYDKLDTGATYYYWIRVVSINGTVGELIGPASATARPLIAELIKQLTGKIDAGVLAGALRKDLDKITLNYADLTAEIADRMSGNTALSDALALVQGDVDASMAFINQEITARMTGDIALVEQMNIIAAVNVANAAAIITEQTARVTADTALASSVTSVATATEDNAAAIVNEITARTSADSALADAITTAQSALSGNIASAQTTLQTNINTVGGKVTSIGALYTAKVTVNGLIGGFGVYNDGESVDAGFDVDTFWVGGTGVNKRKPFIIYNNETFIDEAVIRQLTFSKLRDESGAFIVENGKVKADYINARGLNVTSNTGVVGLNVDAATGDASFGGTLLCGASPAVSGSSMTGSGGVIQSDGSFALGNASTNISFTNGGTLRLNGNVISSGNIQEGSISTSSIINGGSSNGVSTWIHGTTSSGVAFDVGTWMVIGGTITIPAGVTAKIFVTAKYTECTEFTSASMTAVSTGLLRSLTITNETPGGAINAISHNEEAAGISKILTVVSGGHWDETTSYYATASAYTTSWMTTASGGEVVRVRAGSRYFSATEGNCKKVITIMAIYK